MEPAERVALVNKMMGLVNQLYILEKCCPQSTNSGTSRGYQCIEKTTKNDYQKPRANCERASSCRPYNPETNPQYVYLCEVKQPTSTRRSSCKPKPSYPYTVSLPNDYFHKSKTETDSVYKTDFINHFPATKTQKPSCKPVELKTCVLVDCQPQKCRTNPDDVPLISWTPVMEIRKTSNPRDLERQKENPITQYVYVEPPGCPYKPVWSTKDPMCEMHCGPTPKCPALGPPPGYNGKAIKLCCPERKGPPVDRWGQPYDCKQTVDGRAICKPTIEAGPTDWCDAKTSPFGYCDNTEDSKRILTRGKVLNNRFKDPNGRNSKRSSSLYKRPIWPKMDTCYDGGCKGPGRPSKQLTQPGLTFICAKR